MLAKMLFIQFLRQSQIRSLGHNTLFVKHGDNTQWLLNKQDTGLQVKTEIDEGSLDVFAGILLLFQDEHVLVEELLKLLESIQWKTQAYKALAMAPTAQLICSRF